MESCRSAVPGGTITARDRVAAGEGARLRRPLLTLAAAAYSARDLTTPLVTSASYEVPSRPPNAWAVEAPPAKRSADAGPNRVRCRAYDPSRRPTAELQPVRYSPPFES